MRVIAKAKRFLATKPSLDTFYREISGIVPTSMQVIKPIPKPFRCEDPDYVLVVIHPDNPLVLGGTFHIQCLYGTVEFHGYTMRSGAFNENRFMPVVLPNCTHIPVTISAHYLTEQAKTDRLKWRIKEVSQAYEAVCQAFEEEYSAAILISSKLPPVAKFMMDLYSMNLFNPASKEIHADLWRGQTYLVKQDVVQFHPVYQQAVDKVFYKMGDWLQNLPKSIVMVLGNKGVGKSTLIRHLVNRTISRVPCPPVYLLDGDVGQSEKNPPGCISLFKIPYTEPLLGSPISHQETTLVNSYFFGSNTPAVNMGLYVNLMSRLAKEFMEKPENQHAILVVNTVGWVEDEGYNLMIDIIGHISPNLIVNLKHAPQTSNIPRNPQFKMVQLKDFLVPESLRNNTIELQTYPRINQFITRQTAAYELRDYLTCGYFSHCMMNARSTYDRLNEVRPVAVEWKNITVYFHHEMPEVEDHLILSALNASMVALCELDEKECEDVFTIRDLFPDEPTQASIYPKRMFLKDVNGGKPKAYLKCYGFGLIRAIDTTKNLFHVITPVDRNLLKLVNIFALGHEIRTPSVFIDVQRNLSNCPYVARIDSEIFKDETISGLYSALKVQTGHKRAMMQRRGQIRPRGNGLGPNGPKRGAYDGLW